MVGGLFRKPLIQTKEFLESVIKPYARGRSAKQIVVAGKDAPHLARVFQLRLADFEVIEGDALAVKHTEYIMIGLHKEFSGVREGLVLRKPGCLRMPVRADDRQSANVLIKSTGYLSRACFGGK